jgi:hypothetical protein
MDGALPPIAGSVRQIGTSAARKGQILADSGTNPNCQFRTRPTSFCYPFNCGYRTPRAPLSHGAGVRGV